MWIEGGEVVAERKQKRSNTASMVWKERIKMAVMKASEFLQSRQLPSGHWSDFKTNAGTSTDWVTGYVGYALIKGAVIPPFSVSRAIEVIQQDRFLKGGWGYNRWLTPDADSTASCLLFLCCAGIDKEKLAVDLHVLKEHQKGDGGFSTYNAPIDIRRIIRERDDHPMEGWCSTHLCVTVVALRTLLEFGLVSESPEVEKAIRFILSHQHPEGYWESYWWDGRIYATAFALMSLVKSQVQTCRGSIEKAIQWLQSVQNYDGGWNNGVKGESIPFHTALALNALLVSDSVDHSLAIEKGISWLLSHQFENGSWRSHPILRVPSPDCLKPWEVHTWNVSSIGTGIIVTDQNQLFTTATALAMLGRYAQCI